MACRGLPAGIVELRVGGGDLAIVADSVAIRQCVRTRARIDAAITLVIVGERAAGAVCSQFFWQKSSRRAEKSSRPAE